MPIDEPADAWVASLEEARIDLAELMCVSGLSRASVRVLVESGLIEAQPAGRASWRCDLRAIERLRTAGRLRADFDLNESGLLLALTLLERIEALERELAELRCRLPSC